MRAKAREISKPLSDKWKICASLAVLAIMTVIAFAGVVKLGFVNYDDDMFILNRPELKLGLSLDGLKWALSCPAFPYQNWIPLTLISYLVDYQIGQLNPLVYHISNLVLHLLCVLLFCRILHRMTGDIWPSFIAAAFFAVHPLRVESVAWVSERKDVLAGVFWMLTMLAYIRYRERPSTSRYLFVCLAFVFGLVSKPMLVTLPCVLLLMDVWPLKKIERADWQCLLPYVLDKVPLLALSVVAIVGTALFQSSAIEAMEGIPLTARIGNALVSYVAYMGKTLWPVGLAAFYPHPGTSLPIHHVAGAAVLLAAITVAAVVYRRTHPYLLFGWSWFIVTLVPVIGILQVGEQAMADRYTYLTVLGLNIAVAWTLWSILRNKPKAIATTTAIALVALSALILATRQQVTYWNDSVSLWKHALDVTHDNARAHYNLGCAFLNDGRYDDARQHLLETLLIQPDKLQAESYLGMSYLSQGRLNEAAEVFENMVAKHPTNPAPLVKLGNVRFYQKDLASAKAIFEKVLELNPKFPTAHYNLGMIAILQKKQDEAQKHFEAELQISPNDQASKDALKALGHH